MEQLEMDYWMATEHYYNDMMNNVVFGPPSEALETAVLSHLHKPRSHSMSSSLRHDFVVAGHNYHDVMYEHMRRGGEGRGTIEVFQDRVAFFTGDDRNLWYPLVRDLRGDEWVPLLENGNYCGEIDIRRMSLTDFSTRLAIAQYVSVKEASNMETSFPMMYLNSVNWEPSYYGNPFAYGRAKSGFTLMQIKGPKDDRYFGIVKPTASGPDELYHVLDKELLGPQFKTPLAAAHWASIKAREIDLRVNVEIAAHSPARRH